MLCADRKVGATFDSEASASAQPKPTTLPTSQNLLHVCSWSSKAGPVVHMWLSESAESLASFSFPLLKVRLVLTPQPTHPPTSPLSKFAPRLFPVKKEWSTSDYKSRICSEHLIPTFDNGDPAAHTPTRRCQLVSCQTLAKIWSESGLLLFCCLVKSIYMFSDSDSDHDSSRCDIACHCYLWCLDCFFSSGGVDWVGFWRYIDPSDQNYPY